MSVERLQPCEICDPAELTNELKLGAAISFPEDTVSLGVWYWRSTGTLNALY